MNKEELIKAIAEKTKFTKKDTEKFVSAFIEAVKEGLKKDGFVRLIGFGTFKTATRKERKGRNPQTGEEIIIPAKKIIKFSPGKTLDKEVVS